MMRKLILGLAAAGLVTTSAPSLAASQCRDSKGKFIKCGAAAAKATRCRDSKGKYVKCGTAGARHA